MKMPQKNRLPIPPKNRFVFSLQSLKKDGSYFPNTKPKKASSKKQTSKRGAKGASQEISKNLLFVFEEDLKGKALEKIAASVAAKNSKDKNICNLLRMEKRSRAFLAKSGQRLSLTEANVLLIGLGKTDDFHPEGLSWVLRALGAEFATKEYREIKIRFSGSLPSAINKYQKKYNEYFSSNSIKKQKEKQVQALRQKSRASKNKPDKKRPLLPSIDYAAFYSLEDAFFDLVCNFEIGASDLKLLSGHSREKNKKRKKNKKCKVKFLVSGKKKSFEPRMSEAKIVADMLNRSRYLASLPGNYLNPQNYEAYVRDLCLGLPLELQVFGTKQLSRLGCGGILSVGQGSSIPPRMLVIEYKPDKCRNQRPFVLVGKGVTFDSGGISLKPSADMHEMKFDMCGSALALHSIALAAKRGLPLHLVALLGLAENMPDGSAIKPGDVYTAYNGKTVEIQNTDAEGRLILADLLSYASDKYKPGLLFEFSTLTGACIIALGHHVAGVMTPSDALYASIEEASRLSFDRAWRLPHWSIYGEGLKSDIADLRNIGGRAAGTISAMRFLQSFVGEGIPWAHFDIAGAAWSGKAQGSQPAGATGWGIRLMNRYFAGLL